jgi:methylthioribose-1-phosphate isomerase
VNIEGVPPLEDLSKQIFIEGNTLKILDRRALPTKLRFMACTSLDDVAKAIKGMVIQGASAIAYAAAYGLALEAKRVYRKRAHETIPYLTGCAESLKMTRPTGEKLSRVLDKELITAKQAHERGEDLFRALVQFVEREMWRGRETAERCGRNAAALLRDGDRVLTHCYPGPAFIYALREALKEGKNLNIVATETRPYLQGAKLTTLAAKQVGVGVRLVTDGMPAYCMQQGVINKVLVAADRIAMDGSVANKVGTRLYAIAARYHRLPFYVLGYGGPDYLTRCGDDIPIELRDGEEVTVFENRRIAAEGVEGFYPAFDITPPELIDAIVTDAGVVYPPFNEGFKRIVTTVRSSAD